MTGEIGFIHLSLGPRGGCVAFIRPNEKKSCMLGFFEMFLSQECFCLAFAPRRRESIQKFSKPQRNGSNVISAAVYIQNYEREQTCYDQLELIYYSALNVKILLLNSTMYFHLLFALSINSLPVLIDAQQSDSGDQGNFLDQQLQGISQQASGQQNQAAPQGSQQDGQQGGDQGGPGGDQSGYQLGAAIAIGSSQGSQSGAGIAIGSPQGDQSGYPQSPSVVQLPQCSQQQYGYWTYGRDGQLVYKLYSGQLGHWVLGQYGSPIYVSKSIRDCSSYCSCGQSCPVRHLCWIISYR